MPAAESTIIFLPRFTTLVGEGSFITQPLDVAQFASAQFQVWRSASPVTAPTPSFKVYLEESLDAQHWVLGIAAPKGIVIPSETVRLFSYGFRLRWFRLRVELSQTIINCWAEGILR